MKILLMITGLQIGGAEQQVVALADEFSKLGHEVMIIAMTGEVAMRPRQQAVVVEQLRMRKNLFSLVAALIRASGMVRRFSPDVVHSHMVHANLFARILRLACPMSKLVCTAHSTYEGGRLRVWAYRLTNFLADLTTNVSRAAVSAFEAQGVAPRGVLRVVPNGVDPRIFVRDEQVRAAVRQREGVAAGARVVLAVGRLSAAKNYSGLLNAFARLDGQQDALLWIVGDGELAAELHAQAHRLDLGRRVRFFGVRCDVADLMNAADVFVLASAWEGFSLATAEAMASERVVVASRVGGVAEVVGDCGLLVESGDDVALAAALREVLCMPAAQASAWGTKARARVLALFSLDRVARQWLEIYGVRTSEPRSGA